ncbi:helix-turn-helix transcriptional regulator [Luteibacter aegosomatissinici]|uniref:helix-turn-helix transcriptional regulator n=1 Tax=Luteibacter aegosomatissinici TaxID=2911539 RepID=UPI001FFA7BFD|nr:AraC family transcriptional regulator [Luteibacter aegosomatissinici]UPG96022.1 AraC family transcriptional regulator [Luteibacter aegosomatissinici]
MAAFPAQPDLSLRSYDGDTGTDRHDWAQLVLPVRGSLTLDIAGREGRLGVARAAYVPTQAWHTTIGDRPNQSLVLDVAGVDIPDALADRLASEAFVPMAPPAVALVDYMRLLVEEGTHGADQLVRWVPLLLDALGRQRPRPLSRLQAMLAAVEEALALPWTAADMARHANLSTSRVHELFRAELGTTPRAWLAERRLARAREWLARSDRPIATIATEVGYGDQSAMTRAMRDAMDTTPAAYRRQQREAATKIP